MEHHRLLLLGLLKAQAQHGYQLMDFVERNLGHVTNLKKATAYYELKRLQELGLVTARQEQEGGRPPRQVFSLTPEGETAFLDLLRQSLRDGSFQDGAADVGLMFIDWLPDQEVRQLVAARIDALRELLGAFQTTPSHGEGSGVDLAVQHASMRLQTEIHWFEDLLTRLSAGPRRARRKPEVNAR